MAVAETTHVITEATTKPVNRPNQLRKWWKPDMPGYKAYKVKVLGHRKAGKRNLLRFELVGDAARNAKAPMQFEVDLNVSELVWPVLPSTAPMAKPGQYGFLLLSAAWAEAEGVDRHLFAENGSKFPVSTGAD